MVKTLTDLANVERQSLGNDVYWLLEIDFPAGTRYYSSRRLVIEGRTYEPLIVECGELELLLDEPRAGSLGKEKLVVTLFDAPELAERIGELMMENEIGGSVCRVGVFFQDRDFSALLVDILYFQLLAIDRVKSDNMTITLTLVDLIETKGRERIGRLVTEDIVPAASSQSIGKMIPVIVGNVQSAPLLPLRVGSRTRLGGALEEVGVVVVAEDVSRFPTSGSIRIGNEVIEYLEVDYGANTFGTSNSPVIRLTPIYHRAGLTIHEVRESGYDYLVADHQCLSVGNVRSSGRAISDSEYTVDTESIDGRQVQRIRFLELPSFTKYTSAISTLRIDGESDEGYWDLGGENNALDGEKAIDGDSIGTFATIGKQNQTLDLRMKRDYSGGSTTKGMLSKARVGISYFASRQWMSSNEIAITIERDGAAMSKALCRPPVEQTTAKLPEHSHTNDISYTPIDTRPLFDVAPNRESFRFDRVIGEGEVEGGKVWESATYAKDGDFDSFTWSFGAGVSESMVPLRFLVRRKLMDDDYARIKTIRFKVVMSAAAPLAKLVRLHTHISGKRDEVADVTVMVAKAEYEQVIDGEGLQWDDLKEIYSTFGVSSASGGLIRVYEAWLEIEYEVQIPGKDTSIALSKEGSIRTAPETTFTVSSHPITQYVDITDLVKSNGGWEFFSESNGNYPGIKTVFGSGEDDTEVNILNVFFEVDYRATDEVTVCEEFTADVMGMYEGANLLENPADVIYRFLTDGRFLGLDGNLIDDTSFNDASSTLAELGYCFGRMLTEQKRLRDLFAELVFESRCRLRTEGGRFKLDMIGKESDLGGSVFTIDSSVILPGTLAKEYTHGEEIFNRINLFYNRDYDAGSYNDMVSFEDVISSSFLWGLREKDIYLHWHGNGRKEAVTDLGEFLLGKYSSKRSYVRVQTPLVTTHLERGDTVMVNHPGGLMTNVAGEVVGFARKASNRIELILSLALEGVMCWFYDSQNFIRHVAGNQSEYFVVEGTREMSVDVSGDIRLRGEVRIGVLAGAYQVAAIVYDVGLKAICFGYVRDTSYYRCFAIDENGNLLTIADCEIVENDPLTGISVSECNEATMGYFAFSLDKSSAVMAYVESANLLKIKGAVTENYSF